MDKQNNNLPIYHGAGLREQIAPANKRFYTKLTYELLKDFLFDLSYAAQQWGGDTKFVALTGRMGMDQFDQAMKEYNNSNGVTITDHGTFIEGKGFDLGVTGFFKTAKFVNGLELTIKHFPPYDELVDNRQLHPITKKPVESYRFTVLNFGKKDGKSNIKKVAMKNRENVMWHIAGSTDPTGLTASSISTLRSSSFDGYEVNYLEQCGIKVDDPLSCGELILKVC